MIGRAKDRIRKQAMKFLKGNVPSTTPIDTYQNKQLVESRSKDLLRLQVEDIYQAKEQACIDRNRLLKVENSIGARSAMYRNPNTFALKES